jgi:NADH-ubiquinone oxidoreductase chain 2
LIPPLIGFFSKQFVLSSAIDSGYFFMSIVAIFVSVISGSYYLKIIKVLHTESENNLDKELSINSDYEDEDEESDYISIPPLSQAELAAIKTNILLEQKLFINQEELILSNFHSFLISSLTLSILFFFLKPSIILNSTQLLSLSLFTN